MCKSLQGRLTMSNATRGLLIVTTCYRIMKTDVLIRFLEVDGVGAVRLFRGKLFHAVGPATENAWLPN